MNNEKELEQIKDIILNIIEKKIGVSKTERFLESNVYYRIEIIVTLHNKYSGKQTNKLYINLLNDTLQIYYDFKLIKFNDEQNNEIINKIKKVHESKNQKYDINLQQTLIDLKTRNLS